MSDDNNYDAVTADPPDPGVDDDIDDDQPDIVDTNEPSDPQDTDAPADQ